MSKKQEVINALTVFGWGCAGAVLTSMAVNYIPGVKTAKPAWRSAAQGALGLAALVVLPGKYRKFRSLALGAGFAGTLGLIERATGVKTLAGSPQGALSPAEVRALQMQGALPMNGPALMHRMNGLTAVGGVRDGYRPAAMSGGFRAPY